MLITDVKKFDYHPYPEASLSDLESAANLINSAKKPYMLVGQGVQLSGAENELIQFAEKTGIPYGQHSLMGLFIISTSHPLCWLPWYAWELWSKHKDQ